MKNRKLYIYIVSALVLVFGLVYFFVFAKKSDAVGNIQIYNGTAEVTHENERVAATTGTEIELNDIITVAEGSRAAIVLKDGTVIRLESGTTVEVAELEYEGEKLKDVKLKLNGGQAWSRVKPLAEDSQFEVETPAITASVRGTIFNTASVENHTGVYVNSNTVNVTLTQTNGSQNVGSGQILWMDTSELETDFAAGPKSPEESFMTEDWTVFNLNEDEKMCEELNDIPECSEAPDATPTITPTETPTLTLTPTPTIKKATSTPTRTPTKAPTNTPQQPTNTPAPTTAPQPSATPTPVRPTNTPTRTPTLTPTRTPTPTQFILY